MTKDSSQSPPPQILHASTVSVDGHGVLILGPSGSGKSSLALRLISLDAVLVADDRTIVDRQSGVLIASAPATIKGKVEARGVGILAAPTVDQTQLALVIDMNKQTDARMPEPLEHTILNVTLPCLHKVDQPHFPDAVLLYLRGCISHSA